MTTLTKRHSIQTIAAETTIAATLEATGVSTTKVEADLLNVSMATVVSAISTATRNLTVARNNIKIKIKTLPKIKISEATIEGIIAANTTRDTTTIKETKRTSRNKNKVKNTHSRRTLQHLSIKKNG